MVPADVRKNVEFLEASFRKRGFITQQLANDGKPMLFAELPGADPKRKTVLFYMHLDGQPVIPAQWAQKSPWIPVLKRRTAKGDWEEIDAAPLFNADNNQHASNENMRMGNYLNGIRTLYSLITRPF